MKNAFFSYILLSLYAFLELDPLVRKYLRGLWRSSKYIPYVIAVWEEIHSTVRDKVLQAFATMHKDEISGRQALEGLKLAGFEVSTNGYWNDVRSLHHGIRLGSVK